MLLYKPFRAAPYPVELYLFRGGSRPRRAERGALLREEIWAELMPTTFRVVRRKVEPVVAYALHERLTAEVVSPWQLQLVPRLDRRHPTRPDDVAPVAPTDDLGELPPAVEDDAFSILGHWGVLGEDAALGRARAERDHAPHRLEWYGAPDPVERRAWELETEWRPWSGLELLCATELARPRWRSSPFCPTVSSDKPTSTGSPLGVTSSSFTTSIA